MLKGVLLVLCSLLSACLYVAADSSVPIISLERTGSQDAHNKTKIKGQKYITFPMLISMGQDTSEFWRETDLVELMRRAQQQLQVEECEEVPPRPLYPPSRRTLRPICRSRIDFQLCPQCSHFNNQTECELFRYSCKERRVAPSEYRTYCDKKYGKWRAMFIPADYTQCRCCDECVMFRELDQSCIQDEYTFDSEEFLPTTTIDFRAGCNPYWGHPDQELKALRCEKLLRRCVPVSVPSLPKDHMNVSCILERNSADYLRPKEVRYGQIARRASFRYEPPTGGAECPVSCRGYTCPQGQVLESKCTPGAFLPDREQCNCCGRCSGFYQLNQKCAEFKKTVHKLNGTKEIEVEEEFLEPGCDDGLVCRAGRCQDIHTVSAFMGRRKRDEVTVDANEPCKKELKYFKKKYGPEGHLHFEAPQCTPLWLYAPVQCRRFMCYCALEDGTIIQGIKVPRVEVSNMNCDCAREKCRTGSDVECDGYGNYREAVFRAHADDAAFHSRDEAGAPFGTTVSPIRTSLPPPLGVVS